jgi:hypothetical protein
MYSDPHKVKGEVVARQTLDLPQELISEFKKRSESIPNSQEEEGGRVLDRTKTNGEGGRMVLDPKISRRRFLQMGAGAAAGAILLPVLPGTARAADLVDPYSGAIPLVFPLLYGTYNTPVQDNWHANRQGQTYTWNHRNTSSQRARDLQGEQHDSTALGLQPGYR